MARSRPLVLSKEDKEPIYRAPHYDKYPSWKILILEVESQKRKSKKVFSYQEAKEIAAHFKEKLGTTHWVSVVSVRMGYGPPHSKVTDGMLLQQNERGNLWCPYCRGFRRFLYNAWRERRLCEFCQTVETDFHVQANNPMYWPNDKRERIAS